MTEIARITPKQAILKTEARFIKSMPQTMNFEAETGFAIQLLSNNKYLESVAQGSIPSFQQAITNVAAIGLSLNPAEKLAYLLPRNVNLGKDQHGSKVYENRVFLEPSYMGLMKLATDSGSIKWVQASMVRKEDSFTDNGPGERPTHVYEAFAKPSERGEYVGAFCVAKTSDGDYLTTTMTMEDLEGIKARSESAKKNFGPWVTDFAEQCKKTVVRRAFKMWPRSTGMERLTAAVDISNQNEGFEPIINAPNLQQATPIQNEFFVALMEKSDNLGMFVFSKTIPAAVFTNLFNSFEGGKITQNKALVNKMVADGAANAMEWIDSLQNCAGDESQVISFIEEIAPDVVEYIKGQLNPEAQQFFAEVADESTA